MQSDVIIIGGGIIGACCADSLTKEGLQVTLLERTFPASGSSRACDGLILLWDKKPGPELDLGRKSVSLWEELVPQLETDVDFRKAGTVLICEHERDLQSSSEMVGDLIHHQITASMLDAPDLLNLEPNLAPDLAGGAFFPEDYQVDPRRATLAILAKARKQGLQLINGEEVIHIERQKGSIAGWKVKTRQNSYSADSLVCAAGVWTTALLRKIGVDLPIRPRQGHILVIKAAPDMLHHPVLEGGYEATVHAGSDDLQVALVAEMTSAGTMLVGSSRQFKGFDTRVSWEVVYSLARRASRFIPALRECTMIRSYAGLRPWSPDQLPVIGPVAEHDNLIVATGHEGAGICLAPVTGELVADWILRRDMTASANEIAPARLLV